MRMIRCLDQHCEHVQHRRGDSAQRLHGRTDTASGKLVRCPEWDKFLDYVRAGDELVVTRLSRMARSVRHLTEIAALLAERGVDLVVLKQGIDTTPDGRFLFHVIGRWTRCWPTSSAKAPSRPGGAEPRSRQGHRPAHGGDSRVYRYDDTRSRAVCLTKLASLTMVTGDPLQAAVLGHAALDIAATIRSRRATEELRELDRYAAAYQHFDEIAHLRTGSRPWCAPITRRNPSSTLLWQTDSQVDPTSPQAHKVAASGGGPATIASWAVAIMSRGRRPGRAWVLSRGNTGASRSASPQQGMT
jgi:hypothetical protein